MGLSKRHKDYRHILAPLYSTIIYAVLVLSILTPSEEADNTATSSSSKSEFSTEELSPMENVAGALTPSEEADNTATSSSSKSEFSTEELSPMENVAGFTLSWTDTPNKKRLLAIGRASETPRVIEDDGEFLFFEIQYHAAEENPFESVSDLKDYLSKAAKEAGVEAAVFTLGESVRLRNPAAYEAGARMICGLGFLPESKLGLAFEPTKSPSEPVIIKRVKNPSAVEAGVLIGDRLMTVNGKDVAVSDMDWVLKRKVGEEVKITIVSDGVEVEKKFKAVANTVPGD